MKLMKWFMAVACAAALLAMPAGCKSSKLEPGGAYAPTNAAGTLLYSDQGLALADASYKLTYETVQGIMKFERDNRMAIWSISKRVKPQLDQLRPQIVDIDKRWVVARAAYKKNPTPDGLNTMQAVLSEINRLLPIVQAYIEPVKNTPVFSNIATNQ